MSMIAGLISYLRGNEKKTAIVAKERLQIILAHERAGRGSTYSRLFTCTSRRTHGCDCKIHSYRS